MAAPCTLCGTSASRSTALGPVCSAECHYVLQPMCAVAAHPAITRTHAAVAVASSLARAMRTAAKIHLKHPEHPPRTMDLATEGPEVLNMLAQGWHTVAERTPRQPTGSVPLDADVWHYIQSFLTNQSDLGSLATASTAAKIMVAEYRRRRLDVERSGGLPLAELDGTSKVAVENITTSTVWATDGATMTVGARTTQDGYELASELTALPVADLERRVVVDVLAGVRPFPPTVLAIATRDARAMPQSNFHFNIGQRVPGRRIIDAAMEPNVLTLWASGPPLDQTPATLPLAATETLLAKDGPFTSNLRALDFSLMGPLTAKAIIHTLGLLPSLQRVRMCGSLLTDAGAPIPGPAADYALVIAKVLEHGGIRALHLPTAVWTQDAATMGAIVVSNLEALHLPTDAPLATAALLGALVEAFGPPGRLPHPCTIKALTAAIPRHIPHPDDVEIDAKMAALIAMDDLPLKNTPLGREEDDRKQALLEKDLEDLLARRRPTRTLQQPASYPGPPLQWTERAITHFFAYMKLQVARFVGEPARGETEEGADAYEGVAWSDLVLDDLADATAPFAAVHLRGLALENMEPTSAKGVAAEVAGIAGLTFVQVLNAAKPVYTGDVEESDEESDDGEDDVMNSDGLHIVVKTQGRYE